MRQQKSNPALTVTILFAALIIGAALSFAIIKNHNSGVDPAVVTADGAPVDFEPPDLLSRCAPGDACIIVDKSCSFCCHYTAINTTFESDYNEAFDAFCADGIPAQQCSCAGPEGYPACREGRCVIVK
jgi:hypothetical protein